jgi:hypothetical protein
MIKLVIGLAVIGFVMLIAATAILAALNWSSRLYMPVLTALAVGTITGFVSIASSLKSTTLKDSFETTIIIFRDSIGAPIALPKTVSATQRINLVSLLGQLTDDPKPASTDEVFSTTLEAAQYSIVKTILEAHHGGWASIQISGASLPIMREPPNLKLQALPAEDVQQALRANRFARMATEVEYWQRLRFSLPPGTRLTLYNSPSSETTGIAKRGIRLTKPRFFTITFELQAIGIVNGIPDDVEVHASDRSRAATLLLKVTSTAEFEKLTAANQHTEEYKEWAAWMFETLHDRLASPPH